MARKKSPSRPASGKSGTEAHGDESRAFASDLVSRGEAVRTSADGSLPSGATHEIVGEEKDGTPVVKRRRFSSF